jgi:hypothetical protein
MIQTIGPNTLAIRRLEHHAPAHLPIANALIAEMLFGWVGNDGEVHYLRQARTGLNSFSLELADGRIFHFRRGNGSTISVLDKAYNGTTIAVIDSDAKARQWIRSLGRKAKAA